MKPYPKYKDSGIEWIGEVPEGWEVKRLKRIAKIVNGSTPKSSIAEYWDGDIVWVTPADISKVSSLKISASEKKITHEGLNNCGASVVPQGSIILTTRAPIGNLAIANTSLCTNQGCKTLIPTNVYAPYLFYSLFVSKEILQSIGNGTTFKELSTDNLASFMIVLPTKHEQKSIAAYLDRKTAQIDNLISKKQKLIELLKEERTAIINQAVTKGLNPDVPMKDSGIEWLGEIPAHWEVKRLKYIATINEENLSEKTDANIEIKYIDIGNVCLGSIVNEPVTMYFKDAPSRARRIVRNGDTIISTVRTYLKAISYISDVPQNLIVSTGFAVIRLGDDFDKKFISFLLTSEMIVDTICSLSVGVSYPAINASDIANIMIWFPPDKPEQAAIVEHVNKTTTQIDQTISSIENQIDLLQEFRTAIISEVVTGKIDVRDEGLNG